MQDDLLGYLAVSVAVVGFGTNFVPIKRIDAKDGFYFQLYMCIGVYLVGFVNNWWRGWPAFRPFAMLGGFLWCTGNIAVVTCAKLIGLSLGLLIWGSTNMISGWASGKFGLFDLKKEEISDDGLNYAGVCVALFALMLYVLIKPADDEVKDFDDEERQTKTSLLGEKLLDSVLDNENSEELEEVDWISKLSAKQKRVIGCSMAGIMGVFFGTSFDPAQYVMEHSDDFDDDVDCVKDNCADPLDFVFSHFTGIISGSVFYYILYVVYCGGSKNIQAVPEIRLPAILSGVIWGIAQCSWFIANGKLGFSIAFPMITTGPGLIAAILGVYVFDEIKGVRNYKVLSSAFLCTGVANFLIVKSK